MADIPPWLALPPNPAQFYSQGFAHGSQIGAHQAETRMRQQQLYQQQQQAAVEMQQRAIEFSMRQHQQQQELEEAKLKQAQSYEMEGLHHNLQLAQLEESKKHGAEQLGIEGQRIAEERARTNMYGTWHTEESTRKAAADKARLDALAQISADAKAGKNVVQSIMENPAGYPSGVPQAAIASAKASQQIEYQEFPRSGQPPVGVVTGAGGLHVVPNPPSGARDNSFPAVLRNFQTDINERSKNLPNHPGALYAIQSPEQLTKALGQKGAANAIKLREAYFQEMQNIENMRQQMETFRTNRPPAQVTGPAAANAPAGVLNYDPATKSWFTPQPSDYQENYDPNYDEQEIPQ